MKRTPHPLRWVAAETFVASPADGATAASGAPLLATPTILRFAGDDFMQRLLRTLDQRPHELPALRAQPGDGWQAQAATPPRLPDPATDGRSRPARALTRRLALRGFRRIEQPLAPLPAARPLKLFQPVHQRYYLAAAHLVCALPGLPPRVPSGGDRSGFVLRRLIGGVEHGFAAGEDGIDRWVPIAAADAGQRLVADEDLLPVFPLGYAPPAGPPRTLLAGLIPVSRHDDYVFAPSLPAAADGGAPAPAGPTPAQQHNARAVSEVFGPWHGLLERAAQAGSTAGGDPKASDAPWKDDVPSTDKLLQPAARALNHQMVEGSWRVLQGLRAWLDAALPEVAAALGSASLPGAAQAPRAAALHALLGQAAWDAAGAGVVDATLAAAPPDGCNWSALTLPAHLRDALLQIGPAGGTLQQQLDDGEQRFPLGTASDWPGFAFPLVQAEVQTDAASGRPTLGLRRPDAAWPQAPSTDPTLPLDATEAAQLRALAATHDGRLVHLLQAMMAAVHEAAARGVLPASAAQAPVAAELARAIAAQQAADAGAPPRFVLRFVHLRCDCGPVALPVLSAPSEAFELAGFFDPDAPLRPIRIALPFDTTPGGLRKYARNSNFIVSDLLCGQMKKVRGLGFGDLVLSVLPWPFHKDLNLGTDGACNDAGARFGMICSLSIPIITLVAFVLLIVIAALLDLIFRWLPFLIACFPVPGLKGKK